jgi:hypothetical protein
MSFSACIALAATLACFATGAARAQTVPGAPAAPALINATAFVLEINATLAANNGGSPLTQIEAVFATTPTFAQGTLVGTNVIGAASWAQSGTAARRVALLPNKS